MKNSITIILFLFCFVQFSTAQNSASIPYYTGFENGTLDSCWTTSSSLLTGEIAIMTYDSSSWGVTQAHSGLYFLGMHDTTTDGAYNTNQAILQIDLTQSTDHYFEFYWADFGDETEPEDGVYLSDDSGLTFTKVINLPGENYPDLVYSRFYFDLDSMISANGLTANANFIIMFQQYDNYFFHGGNDGHLIDDVSIFGCLIPAPDFSYSTDTTGATYTFTYTGTAGTGLNYNWNFGDGQSDSGNPVTHSYTNGGSFNVELTITDSCMNNYSTSDSIDVSIVSINDYTWIENLHVYPNPGNGIVFIDAGIFHDQIINISIYTCEGKILKSITGSKLNNQPIEINNLETGLYLINIITNNSSTSRVLIIQ